MIKIKIEIEEWDELNNAVETLKEKLEDFGCHNNHEVMEALLNIRDISNKNLNKYYGK